MSDPRAAADPRLLRAYELLRSVFGGDGGDEGLPPEGGAEPGAWAALGSPGALPAAVEDGTWLVSSTEVLLPWEPATAAAAPAVRDPRDPWDAYFAPASSGPAAAFPAWPPPPVLPPGMDAHPALPALPMTATHRPDGSSVSAGVPRPPRPVPGWLEEPLDAGPAAAAAECLYGFLRACGRRDLDAAMALIAADYHAIEGDREVDRDALRHRLEALLDERRGGDLEVAATAPLQPVPYVDGLVLVPAAVQIDHRPESGLPSTVLFEWVAVLEPAPGGWRICALGSQRDLPADAVPASGNPSDGGR